MANPNQAPRKVSELPPEPGAPPAPAAPNTPAASAAQAELADVHRMGATQSQPARRPFGKQEYRLANFPTTPGFVPRWFNDTPGRVARAIAAGYRHVDDHEGGRVKLTVGRAEGGGGQVAFLMEIPQEFYNEDFAAKQANLDIIDDTIRRGRHKAEPGDKRYGGVKMTVTGAARPRRPMGSG